MEANPNFKKAVAPSLTTDFLARIKDADSSSPDISEDDNGSNWGHLQFTAGSMTITTILQSWEAVASTEMARRLIAAAIKTCKAVRCICLEQGIRTTTYLSDMYLRNLVEVLWALWKNAGGVSRSVYSG